MFSVTYNTKLYNTNSRYKVGMIAHFLFKFLKKSEICGITWPHTLLILKYQKTSSLMQMLQFATTTNFHFKKWIISMYVSSVCKDSVLIILYQHRDNSSVLLLHQVTDDFIIEELHRLPLKHIERKWPLFSFSNLGNHSIMIWNNPFEW